MTAYERKCRLFELAKKDGDVEEFKELLFHPETNVNALDKIGGDVFSVSLFTYVCSRNDVDKCKVLLSHPKIDVNLNTGVSHRMFPLMSCSYVIEETSCFTLLLERKDIDINRTDLFGTNIAMWTLRNQNFFFFSVLSKRIF